jgi:phage protein D
VPPQQHAAKLKIEIDDKPLPADIDACLVSAFVDNNSSLPDMFQVVVRDPHRTMLAETGTTIGSRACIKVYSDAHPRGELLISGEVTALEAEFDTEGTMTVIRGYDPSHRLFRGRVTESYVNVTYSDIARKIAHRAALDLGTIDPSPTVHAHVSQSNVNDWQFLRGLADEIGFETGCIDGKFVFRRPVTASGAPAKGTLASDDPLQLTLGTNLLRFRSIVTAAEQVKQVQVRGWDVAQKRALIGVAPARTNGASVGLKPDALGSRFNSPDYVGVGTPYATQAEVDAAAQALAEQIAGAFAEFEGVARGSPKLKAGKAISLGLVKKPFDGKYTLTSTRHCYDPRDGYTVRFTASGRQERSLFGLTSGSGTASGTAAGPPVYGVVPAIVTDVNDPEKRCRVRVRFPWLSDSYTSDWARTVQLAAGGRRGGVFVSEVNDEVLVAFEQGDIRRPYVIGGLYNGVDLPDLGEGLVDGGSGAIVQRFFMSKRGHRLTFQDDDAKSSITISTGDGKMEVTLDATANKIVVRGAGDVDLRGANVKVNASASLELKAGAGLTIDGGPSVKVTGGAIQLN